MDENAILPYIEPIFRFCSKRMNNHHDAEDLTSEIVYYILDGMKKYKIESLDAWVWRIAHNRYARFIDAKSKSRMVLLENDSILEISDADCFFADEESAEQEYQTVFCYLHTLSSEYRNIFVDYYIGEMSIRSLSQKYSLPETTIKWRLNAGRQKIRDRIGEHKMERVYKRINWNTTCCNGALDSDKYLHAQISRAICLAAYEKPLTIEEISINTGIPAMYIEDELPRLEYGDAVCKIGNKYATDFILFRLEDRKKTDGVASSLIKEAADMLMKMLKQNENTVKALDFYGHDFGMDRLGYFVIPYLLRQKIRDIKNHRLNLISGPYPPRKDGGYGWFIVEETADENENLAEYSSGCNVAGDDSGGAGKSPAHIYYYWLAQYFDPDIYHNGGVRWLCTNDIPQNSKNGIVKNDLLSDEDAARLIQNNLIIKSGADYRLNFACFSEEQFAKFTALFDINDKKLEDLLAEWILTVRQSFERFVPTRLHDQINQWISYYLGQIIGYVVDELICRGALRAPDAEKPLTDGVFYVNGNYINP